PDALHGRRVLLQVDEEQAHAGTSAALILDANETISSRSRRNRLRAGTDGKRRSQYRATRTSESAYAIVLDIAAPAIPIVGSRSRFSPTFTTSRKSHIHGRKAG